MRAVHVVFTDAMVVRYITAFLPGLPNVLLQFEADAHVTLDKPYIRDLARGSYLVYCALMLEDKTMWELLVRLLRQPYYKATLPFASDEILKLVSSDGNVQHLQLLHAQRDLFTTWPDHLLHDTLQTFMWSTGDEEEEYTRRSEREAKAEWLMEHHPEACTRLTKPHGSLLQHWRFFRRLLVAGKLDMEAFACTAPKYLDVDRLEQLLALHPGILTDVFVRDCVSSGNLEVLKYVYSISKGLISSETMRTAVANGSLGIVRFLHEILRTDACEPGLIASAAARRSVDIVAFLYENYPADRSVETLNDAISRACAWNNLAVVRYLVPRTELCFDPTLRSRNGAVAFLRSVWAISAATSGDPVQELRAAVIQLTDVNSFEKVHTRCHPTACSSSAESDRDSLFAFAIETGKIEFAKLLFRSCSCVRDSITLKDLGKAIFWPRPVDGELIELLMACGFQGRENDWEICRLLRKAAGDGKFDVVELLLRLGVPCSDKVLMSAIAWFEPEQPTPYRHLLEKYPDCITRDVVITLLQCGEFEYFYELHRPHCMGHCDAQMLEKVFETRSERPLGTWEWLRFMYDHQPAIKLTVFTCYKAWERGNDDVVVFLWLVWCDPAVTESFEAIARHQRIHLYSRLRARVPLIFASVPDGMPWCCQLRFLRQRVECGELTLADVENARMS